MSQRPGVHWTQCSPPAGPSGRVCPAAIVIALFLAIAAPLGAALVLEVGFVTLERKAGSIFHGRCIAKKEVEDGNPVPFTEYTFEVLGAVKGMKDPRGKDLETITFRHAGVRTGRVRDDGTEEAPIRWGIPEHEIGDELVLFLTRESRGGLCSPVGLSQGKFRVIKKDGKAFVENPRGDTLFREAGAAAFEPLERGEAAALASAERTIELSCFLGLCRKVKG
ncbi:MAG TPA: hypothetical protein VMT52_11745 [Planctomycetota bacterium]|nr:hypothetical protein [Planctomycetota bacterium]